MVAVLKDIGAPTQAEFHAAISNRSDRWFSACLRITHNRALAEDAHTVQPDPRPPAPPLLVGGFAFADSVAGEAWSAFGAGRLTLFLQPRDLK